ncbi:FadR/GntR family transcriptional regulator [Nonomuraea muscovyensis]|uniref:GntR family transcriptional repressor for pyruvate dehydrogenase complex n=1 Tax=Nonomuraea muscovyensis TaxID=1124761 RepID=A0A7X0C150_9ACTN|nr:FCD domain-containing protein [Nonomuraea muscovyensis]MBB6345781.1 GntR family transcriptional repressor for pyruvate dehydrogenase complex [Nonomuraea muscovyensis]MDF2706777.1 GntR family transcriptional regulator [Nonomuraea muscovyensis]
MSEVARPTLSDALTERMLELIRTGGHRPGDRLPSTRELSQRFAVTTPTLREALRRLEATGAIEMRHGSGIYVGSAIERIVLPNPNMREMRGAQLLELLDARIVIEPPLAAMAARRARGDDLAELERVLGEAATHLRGEDAELHEANMTFHRATARLAGNSVLHEVVDSLLTVHGAEQREILQIFDDRRRDHDEHHTILQAIVAGDAGAAEERMRAHLVDVKTVIEQRLHQPPK